MILLSNMTQFNQMTELWIFVARPNRFQPQKYGPYLNDLGYKGDLLAGTIKKAMVNEDTTEPNNRKRQEAFVEAVLLGARFFGKARQPPHFG